MPRPTHTPQRRALHLNFQLHNVLPVHFVAGKEFWMYHEHFLNVQIQLDALESVLGKLMSSFWYLVAQ